jgi:predicted nucleic acid-binding protein
LILVDTSVWIDHFRSTDSALVELLDSNHVFTHPFIIGELALGQLRRRDSILTEIARLPSSQRASDDEVLQFIEHNALAGQGIGYVDAHLLVSSKLTPGMTLWTRDGRLQKTALKLGLAAEV